MNRCVLVCYIVTVPTFFFESLFIEMQMLTHNHCDRPSQLSLRKTQGSFLKHLWKGLKLHHDCKMAPREQGYPQRNHCAPAQATRAAVCRNRNVHLQLMGGRGWKSDVGICCARLLGAVPKKNAEYRMEAPVRPYISAHFLCSRQSFNRAAFLRFWWERV